MTTTSFAPNPDCKSSATELLASASRTVADHIVTLLDSVAAYVEERPAELLAQRLLAPRGQTAPSGLPRPPAAPETLSLASMTAYHRALEQWLSALQRELVKVPAGATAVALAGLGSATNDLGSAQGAPADELDPGPAGLAQLMSYMNHLDECAGLLTFYCEILLRPAA